MLKVLIVDDEKAVRNGMRDTIDWNAYGFEVVGDAADSEEALIMLETISPDVIITDICMADINGIEFIDLVKKRGLDIEFVILTGYDEFGYAKNAIEHGVSAYLLKPTRESELIETMLSVKDKIENKQKVKVAMRNYKTAQENNLLYELLSAEQIDVDFICSKCNEYGIQLPSAKYCVACLQIDNRSNADEIRNRQYLILKETVDYCTSVDTRHIISYGIDKSNIVLLVFQDDRSEETDLFFADIRRRFSSIALQTLTVGLSGVFRNLTLLKRAYSQALRALEQKAILGNDRIIHYSQMGDSKPEIIQFTEVQISSIINAVKSLDRVKALSSINDFFDRIVRADRINMADVKTSILELAILLIRATIKNTATMQTVFGRVVQPAFELQPLETIRDIHNWICEIAERLIDNPEVCALYSYSHYTQQTILYIMSNYSKPITVSAIAEKLYINPSYLMRSIKKETGKTFTEYLLDYRMKIAKQLLHTNEYKIYEVGAMVGYPDSNHFSKLFKKTTGHSPKYYSGDIKD